MDISKISEFASNYLILGFIAAILVTAYQRKVAIYDELTDGGSDSFSVIFKILPHMIAMLVAVGMLRSSGAIEIIAAIIDPVTSYIGLNLDTLTIALMRPFSGSGSLAMLADIGEKYGGDHITTLTAATIIGSTETTFYLIAVYFGSVGITKVSYAIKVGIMAEIAGVLASVYIAGVLFG